MNKIKKNKTDKPFIVPTVKKKIVRKEKVAKKVVNKKKPVGAKKAVGKRTKTSWKAFSDNENQYISPMWESFAQANSRALSHFKAGQQMSLHQNNGSRLDVITQWKAYCITEQRYVSLQWETRQEAEDDAQPHINHGHNVRFDQTIQG